MPGPDDAERCRDGQSNVFRWAKKVAAGLEGDAAVGQDVVGAELLRERAVDLGVAASI